MEVLQMHYFKFNISDYYGSTGGLTPTQSYAYIKLICMYYEKEAPLHLDVETFAGRNAVSKEDVDLVLRYYFQQETDGTYFHARIEKELAKMKRACAVKSDSGKTGAHIRWNKAVIEAEFDKFWKKYPKKQNRARALKAWIQQKPDLKVCLESLKKHKRSDQWLEDEGKFIPYASTWINGEQWEDELPSKVDDYNLGVK